MPKRTLPWWLPLVAASCSSRDDSTACTLEAEAAVVVQLVAAGDNTPVTGATLVLSEGPYSATMSEGPDGTYYGGFERPGTYQVEATAPGYQTETVTDIVARALQCGPETQRITIALHAAPPWLAPVLILWERSDGSFGIRTGAIVAAD